VAILVRTWNLFHGNTQPPGRKAYLEEMVRLASADRPAVLCVQEVPAWALPRLREWAGMTAFPELAARPCIGPFPSTAKIGRLLTAADPGLLRSAFSGQGNAILLDPRLQAFDSHALVLNPAAFRRGEARRLELGPAARLAWGRERRICQAVRAALPDGRRALVVNLHATSYPPDRRLADAEVMRAADFARALAEGSELCVLAGDFNVEPEWSETLARLAAEGFSATGGGVDHILVRGAPSSPVERWPDERRRLDGVVLSDHAPLEVAIG
jgi:endonuclease/exonuclease/phosphatase family metal-dependent hydrolase